MLKRSAAVAPLSSERTLRDQRSAASVRASLGEHVADAATAVAMRRYVFAGFKLVVR
jgi:hypothetical protein